jgi:thiol:disulfide interchange protein DsbD
VTIFALLPQIDGVSDALQGNPLVAVSLLFVAGVLTSLTPCIYPMIPITVGVIGGAAGVERSRARTAVLTLTYVAGLALFYALLGTIAGATGMLFGTIGANPWARFAMANLLLLFGLAMFDVFPVAAPQKVVAWVGSLPGGTLPGVFLLGATSGIVAAPCGAPAFAAVITWVAGTGSPVLGFLYLLVFSLGMTALLVAVGLFSGTLVALPRSGPWMVWIKRLGGILLIAMAEYYFVQAGMVL